MDFLFMKLFEKSGVGGSPEPDVGGLRVSSLRDNKLGDSFPNRHVRGTLAGPAAYRNQQFDAKLAPNVTRPSALFLCSTDYSSDAEQ
jgi:hypothetical protein